MSWRHCVMLVALTAAMAIFGCSRLGSRFHDHTYIYGMRLDAQLDPVFMVAHEMDKSVDPYNDQNNMVTINAFTLSDRYYSKKQDESHNRILERDIAGCSDLILPLSDISVVQRDMDSRETAICKVGVGHEMVPWMRLGQGVKVIASLDWRYALIENGGLIRVVDIGSNEPASLMSFKFDLRGRQIEWFSFGVDANAGILILCLNEIYQKQEVVRISMASNGIYNEMALIKNSEGQRLAGVVVYGGELCVLAEDENKSDISIVKISDRNTIRKWSVVRNSGDCLYMVVDHSGELRCFCLVNPYIFDGSGYPDAIQMMYVNK